MTGNRLDPIYTARAFAGLEADAAAASIPQGSRVLFLHTGGRSITPLLEKRKGAAS